MVSTRLRLGTKAAFGQGRWSVIWSNGGSVFGTNELRFSLQRPRKRLARADLEAQATWVSETLPAIKKSQRLPRRCDVWRRGELDGSLHRTWARVGVQPHVDTYGQRKTAHVFGAVSLHETPSFHYMFAPVFNGDTFLLFLQHLVRRTRRKIFLILDNGPCHNLTESGKLWLQCNRHDHDQVNENVGLSVVTEFL